MLPKRSVITLRTIRGQTSKDTDPEAKPRPQRAPGPNQRGGSYLSSPELRGARRSTCIHAPLPAHTPTPPPVGPRARTPPGTHPLPRVGDRAAVRRPPLLEITRQLGLRPGPRRFRGSYPSLAKTVTFFFFPIKYFMTQWGLSATVSKSAGVEGAARLLHDPMNGSHSRREGPV